MDQFLIKQKKPNQSGDSVDTCDLNEASTSSNCQPKFATAIGNKEMDYLLQYPLEITDECKREHSSGHYYQVYFGGKVIDASEDTLILETTNKLGKTGNIWFCRHHNKQGERCSNTHKNIRSTNKRTVFNHVAAYYFTFRCCTCGHQSNTLTNLSKHIDKH